MIGASLSKWTMSYFGVALLGAESLMIASFGFPSQPVAAPQALILVHLVAIGWLSLLLSGTLIQFVPVLVAKPLAHPELPAVALALLVVGLAGLIAGSFRMVGPTARAGSRRRAARDAVVPYLLRKRRRRVELVSIRVLRSVQAPMPPEGKRARPRLLLPRLESRR